MDTTPDNTPEDDLEGDLSLNIRFHNGDTMTLQQVIHGMQPMVLVRPTFDDDDDDSTNIIIDATGPESTEELAEFFDMMAQMVRAGEITSYRRTDDTAEEN